MFLRAKQLRAYQNSLETTEGGGQPGGVGNDPLGESNILKQLQEEIQHELNQYGALA